MKKCPRCERDIKDDEKYCPYCGLDLQGKYRPIKKNKKMTSLIYLIIFVSFMILPLLYNRMLMNLSQSVEKMNATSVELKEMTGEDPTAILDTYTTLADYKNKFTNVDSVIANIQAYERTLSEKAENVFNKEYSITLFDNYDVNYTLTYTTQVQDDLTMKVQRTFDRSHQNNKEEITFRKTGVNDFEELLFDEDELEIVKLYTGDQDVTDKLMSDFSERRNEFNEKKKTLGHYGIGNYAQESSFVVHRIGENYYSEMTYSHEVSQYIH